MSEKSQPRVLTSVPANASGFKFVTLTKQTWVDAYGKQRLWETAERTTRRGDVDAVLIPTILKRKDQEDHIILVSQFRPPANNYMLEFPAGLIDHGETAADAALRELREETGYIGNVIDVSPVSYADPGMSNANLQFVTIEIDGNEELNLNPRPQQEEGEDITTHLVPLASLAQFIRAKRAAGMDVDGKLLAWADAYNFSKLHKTVAAPSNLSRLLSIGFVALWVALLISRGN